MFPRASNNSLISSLRSRWLTGMLTFVSFFNLVLKHATEKLPSVCNSNRYNITLSSPCFHPLMLHAVKGTNQDNKSCKFYTLLIKYKPNVSILFFVHTFVKCTQYRIYLVKMSCLKCIIQSYHSNKTLPQPRTGIQDNARIIQASYGTLIVTMIVITLRGKYIQ